MRCDRRGKTLEMGNYRVTTCIDGHVHITIERPSINGQYALDSNETYEFAQALLLGFDRLNGL
jgi:hypothetical protein